MSEKKEMQSNRSNNGSDTKKNLLPGSLFSMIMIVAVVLVVFVLVNSQLSAGGRDLATTPRSIGLGRGSCCSAGSSAVSNEASLASAALEYYRVTYGSVDGLQASVEDFGCHQEVTISRNNEVVKRFGYSGSSFYDLTP